MNDKRRMLLKFIFSLPWLSWRPWGKKKEDNPEYIYDWTANKDTGGTSTDPRMPVLGYGPEAPFVLLNGILMSHGLKSKELSEPGMYITRVKSGPKGWIEYSIRDKDNNPIIRRVIKTEEELREEHKYTDKQMEIMKLYSSTSIHNKHWKTFTVEEIWVEKIRGDVKVIPRNEQTKKVIYAARG